jgi:hypothetical protein
MWGSKLTKTEKSFRVTSKGDLSQPMLGRWSIAQRPLFPCSRSSFVPQIVIASEALLGSNFFYFFCINVVVRIRREWRCLTAWLSRSQLAHGNSLFSK